MVQKFFQENIKELFLKKKYKEIVLNIEKNFGLKKNLLVSLIYQVCAKF